MELTTQQLATLADELYGLTPDSFTLARNDRAKDLRSSDRTLADALRRLPKPSTAAWVVNMMVRHDREQVDQVLALGTSLRQAQEKLDGAELRELNRQRRQLTAAVTSRARGLARDLGVRVSDGVAVQVEETLRAAMTDESAANAVRTGQLVSALSATGVGQVDVSAAIAVPEAIGVTPRAVPTRRSLRVVPADSPGGADVDAGTGAQRAEADRAAAAQAAEVAGQEVERAERKLDKARRRAARLEARSLQLQGRMDELRRRMADLEHEQDGIDEAMGAAEAKRERVEERVASARAARESAYQQLADLDP